MEIIRKKICLEDFISRIPSNLNVITGDTNNGSWGKIPNKIKLTISNKDRYYNYKFIMDLYYKTLKLIINSEIYKLQPNNIWIPESYEKKTWIDYVKNSGVCETVITFTDEFPNDKNIGDIIGITNTPKDEIISIKKGIQIILEDLLNNKDKLKEIEDDIKNNVYTTSYKYFKFIYIIDKLIGKIIVNNVDNNEYQGLYVPYFLYTGDTSTIYNIKEIMNNLKTHNNCCDNLMYEEYGGDDFYNFLNGITNTTNTDTTEGSDTEEYELPSDMPTIDIPILLTGNLLDLGQYKSYDIIVVDENGETEDVQTINQNETYIIETKGESKIRTLRKRKICYDDSGNSLPFIINNDNYNPILPFEEKYIKNVQSVKNINGQEYIVGDAIVDIIYRNTSGITENLDKATEIEFTYVIGGTFHLTPDGIIDDFYGENPFTFTATTEDIYGIWYKETFPLKDYSYNIKYNNEDLSGSTKIIDFESKEITYSFPGIDYERTHFILCENIKYLSNYFLNYSGDLLFFDEKMLGLSVPLKEVYNITIDRGATSVYEKHLQLTEIKSWDDLEKYRNGMFLNN